MGGNRALVRLGKALFVHLGLNITSVFIAYNGILVPVRTSFGLCWRGGKTYNVST